MSEEEITVNKKKSEAAPRRRPKKIVIPRREPSTVIPEREMVFITPDKTTCAECTCFPKEDPYRKPKKLSPCLDSPRALYELAADVVDGLEWPTAFEWSEDDVADWMDNVVGLPEYRECILDNHINGLRLLMLEDPSKLPDINIHYLEHIKMITSKVREEFSTGFIRFVRSIGLPPRKPLTHCTWFKSRTGPSWGIRQNWTRCGILRWMKILMPEPLHLDHWDLVWYQKPSFPKVMFARTDKQTSQEYIPIYKPNKFEVCKEYLVPRKFRIHSGIPESEQMIWMEHRPESAIKGKKKRPKKKSKEVKFLNPKDSRLVPKKINTEGLRGKDLILARRKMPKPKFFA